MNRSLIMGWIFALPALAQAEIRYGRDIRPILSNNCFFCHGPDPKTREEDLRLDLREEAIAGKAFVPGKPEKSRLIKLINATDEDDIMPPPESHKSLTVADKKLLHDWIQAGAKYEPHWAYQAPHREPGQTLDTLVSRDLVERGFNFSPPADPATLLRRLHFDVTGLPPNPEQVAAFHQAHAKDPEAAVRQVVEQLLASPHFGERMAVSWLDGVRYADTVGYHGDEERSASPYRDYVIDAFNSDKSFAQFTIEQIAGDLLPDATLAQKVAASYNRLNQISEEGGIQDAEYLAKYQAERVRTTTSAWLGSTLACAECHDHKFDPFTAKDFYSFAAYFSDILEKGAWNGDGNYQEDPAKWVAQGVAFGKWGPLLQVPNPEQSARLEQINSSLTKLRNQRDATTADPQALGTWIAEQKILLADKAPQDVPPLDETLPEPASIDLQLPAEAIALLNEESPDPAKLAAFHRQSTPDWQKFSTEITTLETEHASLLNAAPTVPATVSATPRPVRLLNRGDWQDKTGPIVEPATPAFLTHSNEAAQSRPTRLDLANWMVSRENPLTARVFANRLWARLFGIGLAKDTGDLGMQGEFPSHPELLDWLAVDFMENQWSVKHLMRTILLSRTYQQSSTPTPPLAEIDPKNRLLARQSQLRLPAELIRDNALAVAGLLNPAIGGPSAKPYQPAGYYRHLNYPQREYQPDKGELLYRRGLYTHWQRTFLHPMLKAFDAPAREECSPERSASNTPIQALNLLNDPAFTEAARVMATRLLSAPEGTENLVARAWSLCLSRPPTAEESQILGDFHTQELQRFTASPEDATQLLSVGAMPAPQAIPPAQLAAATSLARAILNLHETITRY
jgi:hypothetical protein